jgi:hypothetical protein
MTFEEWWGNLSDAEQKLIGINNARFVWEEAQKTKINVIALPNYTMARFGNKIAIMSTNGEGGAFDIYEFDKAVSQFFAEKF